VSTRIEFHPLFWEDVEGHALYLDAQAALGGEFLDEVENAIEAIRKGPLMWACLYSNTRHYMLGKFRRHIIHYEFFPHENMVRFYGLFHGAEDPAKWSDRL
jgi:hypothetical protein